MGANINVRDRNIFIGIAAAAIVIGALIFYTGVSTIPDVQSGDTDASRTAASAVPFTLIAQGAQSGVPIRINYLIKSSTEMSELWKIINATGTPPTIDFKTQAVIAVFAGKASASSIAISKIEDSDARMVSIVLTKPEGSCAKALTAQSPYEIAVVAASALPLSHKDISTFADCPR